MTDPSETRGERLESWKKIAAYLRRDVRTVQRWEQSNGLPVHRHQRAQRAIPYAYAKNWTHGGPASRISRRARHRPQGPGHRAAAALLLMLLFGSYGAVPLLKDRGAPVSRIRSPCAFVDLSEGMNEGLPMESPRNSSTGSTRFLTRGRRRHHLLLQEQDGARHRYRQSPRRGVRARWKRP